jgi:hypothetical protein
MASSNHIAFTLPINPPSATATLNRPQVWRSLEVKIRHAQDFVPAIQSCDVIEETHDLKASVPVTVREAVMREGQKRIQETCKAYEPTKVDFWQDGSLVSIIISEGPGGAEEGDLWMTYVFGRPHPELEGGAKGQEEARKKELAMAKMAVGKSIESIREMVKDGRIEV